MPAFDTSVLVALFDRGHPSHDAAVKAFRDAPAVLLHPCILAELSTVIRRNARKAGADGNSAARTALRHLLAQPRCRVFADIQHGAAFERYLKTRGLSLTDAILLQFMDEADRQPPVTFDRRIQKAAARP